MNDKERAAMQQALEALETDEQWGFVAKKVLERRLPAITALREALEAEQAEQAPVGEVDCIYDDKAFAIHITGDVVEGQKLYAAPVRTKDLTDVDLWKLWEKSDSNIAFARAVIAAYKEKNK